MINFLEVEKSVIALKSKLAAGEIDEYTFETRLLDFIDVAEDGYYWMFGHESERWYRHDGQQWLPREPGELFAPLAEMPPDEDLKTKWQEVNWGWLIASLIIMALIGAIVYYSML